MSASQSFSWQSQDQAREDANAWIAKFAPLVLTTDALAASDLRDRLNLVDQLRQQAPDIKDRLATCTNESDHALTATFTQAVGQLDSIESDLRKTLARVSPGDPAGLPDLQVLTEKLNEREAREEMGLTNDPVPAVLELCTSPANWGQAFFIFIFGLGWTSFTTFHAFMMIGGMMKAFGYGALALLAFYAIFFAVGFLMFAGAVAAASTESITLDGHELTVKRKLGSWLRQKKYHLSNDMPTIDFTSNTMQRNNAPPSRCIELTDANGSAIRIATGVTEARRIEFRNKIQAYLKAQPAA